MEPAAKNRRSMMRDGAHTRMIELFTKSSLDSSQAYRAFSKMRSSSVSYFVNDARPSSSDDQRIDNVVVEELDDISAGIGTNLASINTKAAFIPGEETGGEQGVVHLYRDIQETPGLYRKEERLSSIDLGTEALLRSPRL